jgi:hypothetical protein
MMYVGIVFEVIEVSENDETSIKVSKSCYIRYLSQDFTNETDSIN